MLEALLILACFVSGFLTKGFYDSIRERKRLEERHHKILKTWGIK